jgi:predicted transposase YdaD
LGPREAVPKNGLADAHQALSLSTGTDVLILNPIGGRLSGTYKRGGLSLVYHAHHLWDYPAEELLSHPTFYPLAVLGHTTSPQHRAQILESAIQHAQQMNNTAETRSRTINIATTLATIHLPTVTIEAILERTKPMTVTLAEIYEDAVKDRYLEQGLEQGLKEGRQQGVTILLALAEKCHGRLSDTLVSALRNSALPLDELTDRVIQAPNATELERTLGR